jgi:hypothetical protein
LRRVGFKDVDAGLQIEVLEKKKVFQMIHRNMGVAVVPQDAARVCELPGLIAVPLIDRRLIRTLGIVTSVLPSPNGV